MRGLKLVGAFFAILALTAVAAASASAALPEFLPGSGTFTGKSGVASLQVKGGATITCKTSTSTGELTGVKSDKVTITFEGCTVAGLTVLGLGAAKGTIVVTLDSELCQIGSKDVGVILTILPTTGLHIEVPTGKHLILVIGSVIGLLSPINSSKTGPFPLTVAQKEGVQAIEKCEGGTAKKLESSLDGGAFVQAGQEAAEGSLTFAAAHELMD
jgi:hypothetical protein